MNKIKFEYGPLCASDSQMAIGVQVWDSEPTHIGIHIAASSVFNARMIKGLSKKNIEELFANLTGSIEACNEEIERRQSEKYHTNPKDKDIEC